jgi:hypothetical protein
VLCARRRASWLAQCEWFHLGSCRSYTINNQTVRASQAYLREKKKEKIEKTGGKKRKRKGIRKTKNEKRKAR